MENASRIFTSIRKGRRFSASSVAKGVKLVRPLGTSSVAEVTDKCYILPFDTKFLFAGEQVTIILSNYKGFKDQQDRIQDHILFLFIPIYQIFSNSTLLSLVDKASRRTYC